MVAEQGASSDVQHAAKGQGGSSDFLKQDNEIRIAWFKKLQRITENVKRWTSTPESEQSRIADFQIAKHIREKKNWLLVDDAWRADLMPLWELLLEVATGQMFFVVKVYKNAVIAWPAEQIEVGLYQPSLSCKQFVFRFCFDFKQYQVVPTLCYSPLHLCLLDYSEHLGALFRVTGAHQSLLLWQCEHGFPFVSEEALTRTCESLEASRNIFIAMISIVTDMQKFIDAWMQAISVLLIGPIMFLVLITKSCNSMTFCISA